jgi:DNA-binding CsgD family transcriptional regulator
MPRGTTKPTLTTRQREVLRLTKAGLTPQAIAKVLDLTTQRVYQLLVRLRELGEIEEEGAS